MPVCRPFSDSAFQFSEFYIFYSGSWYSASNEDGCGMPLFEGGCCLRCTPIVFASFNKLLIFYAYLVKIKSKENKKISILRAFMYTFWAFVCVCVRVFTFCFGYMNFKWKLLMPVLFSSPSSSSTSDAGGVVMLVLALTSFSFRWFAFVYVHEWMDERMAANTGWELWNGNSTRKTNRNPN